MNWFKLAQNLKQQQDLQRITNIIVFALQRALNDNTVSAESVRQDIEQVSPDMNPMMISQATDLAVQNLNNRGFYELNERQQVIVNSLKVYYSEENYQQPQQQIQQPEQINQQPIGQNNVDMENLPISGESIF
jgi:hypothetical protein